MTEEKIHIKERPPIVAVLGHVDHGKSTLLDYIRKSNVVDTEAGGITQHVAAYEVVHEHEGRQKQITFLDTPGHAAFKAIRKRGANIADVAILVVAADDGVKEQTLEALESIKNSGIPFVIAINKVDKPNADIERTKHSLLEHGIYLEGLGGTIPWSPISAKTGEGVDALLDLVLISAELEELKGDTSKMAEGYVIETHRDPKRGIAATLIITDGTMTAGHFVRAGNSVAPLRIMNDHTESQLKEASFSSPVTVIGFDSVPDVGAPFRVYENKKDAEFSRLVENKKEQSKPLEHEEGEEESNTFHIVIKADVAGSLEAISNELQKLSDEIMRVQVVHSGIGTITEADIKSALSAKGAIVVGFNVNADATATELARQNNIPIETFSIIYELSDRVKKLIQIKRPVQKIETVLGKARILKVFSAQKDVHLIGGEVIEGELCKKRLVRVVRKKEEIGVGEITSLQSAKQSVDKVEADTEFGAQIEADFEMLPGDMLECFIVDEV
ncbi:MAG: translation initiation factor IF-2 [Candidatus Taylorbacteria bacterium CG10_big_fil_rev_8_21_14_0_10_41_48]|uniref:Translation initiation factor IF-2 n=1 Tax=Candidatus Taylorbacteria bacterium CG10_big_fil_rev_8_21_14_0_10_41_48 TaxID=1975024 RepID=A0A2M8LBX1_9BACT|nr:MAG: translation initiation factor IF-2 [Candidatus Taylorbacteria bacterium CG10_big_fil_rev_8_21_14_0_10_41_48]